MVFLFVVLVKIASFVYLMFPYRTPFVNSFCFDIAPVCFSFVTSKCKNRKSMKKMLTKVWSINYVLLTVAGLLLAFLSCTKDSVNLFADTNSIISFSFGITGEQVTIREEGKDNVVGNSINVVLPAGTAVDNLTPTIVHDGVSTDPESGVAQDFTNPINYTVTAENGSEKVYRVIAETEDNTKDILKFTINGIEGVIDETNQTIVVSLPSNTDVTALQPVVEINGQSVDPASGVAQDFTNPVTYTVTATNSSTKDYTVTIELRDDTNDILSFSFEIENEEITIDQNAGTITALLPNSITDVTALTPIIIHNGASIDPESGVEQDFSSPVLYTVTAVNGTTKTYTVTATVDNSFILTFNSTTTVTIPTNPDFSGQYNYEVDSNGDGVFEGSFTGDATFNFSTSGPHTLRIQGDFPAIQFGSGSGTAIAEKVTSIDQWGVIEWQSMEKAFEGCTNMTVPATDVPNLDNVTSMASMFAGASSADPDVTDWNVVNVTDMASMFAGASSASPNVTSWNVINVTDMSSMFADADNANPNVTKWNIANVTDMRAMLRDSNFNREIHWSSLNTTVQMDNMLDGSKMSDFNYTITLYVFADRNVNNITLGAVGRRVSSSGGGNSHKSRSKDVLLNRGWQITDSGNNDSQSLAQDILSRLFQLESQGVISN